MIKKMSSQELNQIFEEAKNNSDKAIIDIQKIKEEISKKLMIINYVNEFADQKLDSLNAGIVTDQTKISFFNNCSGLYEKFGYTVHPKFKDSPIDIFNLKLLNSDGTIGRTMFKQSMTCKVNDVDNDNYINLLMNDNDIDKQIIFDEFQTDTIKIEYELDNTVSIGTSRFNLIEIDPFISGAYNLETIECYSIDSTGILSTTPTKTLSGFNNIGKTRIILDKKIKFSKVVLTFKVNFETEMNNIKIYPFGLKHIYFMEADFLADTSFIIVPIYADNFIEYIYNDIELYTVNGKIPTTCDMYNIEFYLNYINNTLTGRVYTSSSAQIHRISKNTSVLYAKIPLVKQNEANNDKEYLSLNGLKLNFTTSEELII